jgi:hypothetical protein
MDTADSRKLPQTTPLKRYKLLGLEFMLTMDAPDWRYRDMPRIRFIAWLVATGRIRE